ncbi:Uma2 family endonuclease [Kitasatospora sp. NPDC092948]|uniref:Uma2 family endonuclease n=1 Tax=Kitasatospora sp. NPDC092948 TaxID=3364088 RepID=UPI00380CFA51
MTSECPHMLPGQFEAIAETAETNDVTFEFVGGRLGVKPMPDGDHAEIVMWLMERCMAQRPDLRLYPGRRLRLSGGCRVKPDGVLARRRAFIGHGEWSDPAEVLMVVEVTSRDPHARRCDRAEKPAAYARAGIPVFLLVDREAGAVSVFSEPRAGRYEIVVTLTDGHTVDVPKPVSVALDTEVLKELGS